MLEVAISPHECFLLQFLCCCDERPADRFALIRFVNVFGEGPQLASELLDADTAQARLLRSRAWSLRFVKIFQPPQLAFLQNSGQVNQDDEPVAHLADSGYIVQFAIFENIWRKIDGRFRDLQHFRSGIYDQPNHLGFNLDHQDSVLLSSRNRLFAKTLAQIDHRDDLAAQINHAFHILRRFRHGGYVRHAHNLMHMRDANPKGLAPDSEADDL